MTSATRARGALGATLVALLLATTPASAQTPREHLSIVAPPAVFALAEVAAERFAAAGAQAMPVVERLDAETSLRVFCAGEGARHPDVLASARRLTRGDLGACAAKGVAVSELLIGHQAVALAQNPGPAPLFLTRRQLFLALAREVPVNGRLAANPYRLWSDIDFALPVKPIAVVGPPPGSPLRDAFVELIMVPAAAEFPALRGREAGALRDDGLFTAPEEDETAVRDALRQRPEAIGIFSYNHLALRGEGLLSVPLDGVAPSLATVADANYRAARPVYVYAKPRHATMVPGLEDYLAGLLGPAASGPEGFLTARGLVPLAPAAAEAQRAAARSLPPL